MWQGNYMHCDALFLSFSENHWGATKNLPRSLYDLWWSNSSSVLARNFFGIGCLDNLVDRVLGDMLIYILGLRLPWEHDHWLWGCRGGYENCKLCGGTDYGQGSSWVTPDFFTFSLSCWLPKVARLSEGPPPNCWFSFPLLLSFRWAICIPVFTRWPSRCKTISPTRLRSRPSCERILYGHRSCCQICRHICILVRMMSRERVRSFFGPSFFWPAGKLQWGTMEEIFGALFIALSWHLACRGCHCWFVRLGQNQV